MDFKDAKSWLAKALRSLDPTGPLGFEGLLRDLLVELTGIGFGLAKSGPQGGSDVRSLGNNLFEVALEAKRYGEDTVLRVDALQAKLFETSRSQNGTDLWILAATRAISATDQETLERTGLDLGITVLILDWPPESDQLPDLAVLCVEAGSALTRHLGADPDLDKISAAIRNHSDYSAAAQRLRHRLTEPDIGYAAATKAMKAWMLGGLSSEQNAASRLGGRFNDLLSNGPHYIRRPRYEEQLDKWLSRGEPTALLGDEGLGKTWLFLSWWHARTTNGEGLPLTLFVPAKEVAGETLDVLCARLLCERLGKGTIAFWQRRIEQWLQLNPDGPQILLMIDGLNQHWQKRDWNDLLQPAFDDRLNGRFSILVSCWPEHWNELHQLAPLTPRPVEIRMERFDDGELDTLLNQHGLRREDFNAAVLEMMRVPRLSILVIKRRAELMESGDITAERLAIEDWKHRIDLRGAQLALSDREFQAFVADLGTELHGSIDNLALTRRNIFERLGRDSGKERDDLQSTVAELIAGSWLVPLDLPHRFRVNPALVPFALGLTLTHQLRTARDDAAASTIVAEFIDPFKGQSLGVNILRAAVTTALLDSATSRPARRFLLTRWIAEQNFSRVDFDAFWRIIGLDTDLVLQVVEDFWLGRRGSMAIDEIMIKGLAKAYEFPAVAPLIAARTTRWLGWYWDDPHQGLYLSDVDLKSPESQQRQKATEENFEAWRQFKDRAAFPATERCASGHPSWLAHRAFGVMSFLPRINFVEAIAAWTVSRAIMGIPQHQEELAWILRLNPFDYAQTRAEVRALIDRLLESNQQLALFGACWLLEALADEEATNLLGQVRPWTVETETSSLFAPPIREEVLDPASTLDMKRVEEEFGDPPNRGVGRFPLRHHMLILARTDPDRLRAIIGEAARCTTSLATPALRERLNQLSGFLPILSDDERDTLEEAVGTVLVKQTTEPVQDIEWWQRQNLALQIVGLNGVAQFEMLIEEAGDAKFLTNLDFQLTEFTQADIRSALCHFPAAGDQAAVRQWLMLLVKFAGHDAIEGWQELPALLRHSDPEIAERAIILAERSSDPAALTIIAEADWTARGMSDRHRRYHRSVALLQASQVLRRPALLRRADDEMTAAWLEREPDNPAALQSYEGFIRTAIEERISPTTSLSQTLIKHTQAIAILLEKANADFWSWLAHQITNNITTSNIDLMYSFPLIDLTSALMTTRADLGLALWSKLMDAMQEGPFKNADLKLLPFRAPGEKAYPACNRVLESAVNDQDIADVARYACKHDRVAWLTGKVRELARSGETASLAKSVTLLGFANESEAVNAVWAEVGIQVPRGGWLADIYRLSRRAYDRNRWARHWYHRFLAAKTDGEALAAHLLLTEAIDFRAVDWIVPMQIRELSSTRRRLWYINETALNAACKKRRDNLKKTLFWTKTMAQTQLPWL